MRRVNVNGVAVLVGQAIGGGATAASANRQRVLQAALYGTCSNFNSERFGLSSRSAPPSVTNGCVAGTKSFSAAATSLAQDHAHAHAHSHKFSPKDVVLYQYEACPFCNKVKAFLDYYKIPYGVVEVNPINKKEIKWSDYKKVPILKVDGEQMVDSSDIIDKLFQKLHPDNPVASGDEETKWRGWVDNHLVHVLSPNIYRTTSEAIESFDYITTHGNFSFTERIIAKYAGAAAMYFVAKNLKKKHNITNERAALYEAAETWVDALKGRKFLGGSNPNLADLAVFGVLRPIRHLKSGKDMVQHTRIGDWYTGMESEVGESSRIKA
ncbi:prostaglandin E synthase 2-like [Quercus lobata]|uniref:Prostaglandin E synthase 2 n=1 Tax=Quercus lobata TaxID=97700 RepID=A0A7N2KSS3_QUELO|nr:prostaglandin E synthase 2-like [Quercus lobata]